MIPTSTKPTRLLAILFFWGLLTPVFLEAQWTRLPGPFGGNVQQFARKTDTLFALTSGGIYRTHAGSPDWKLVETAESLGNRRLDQNWYYKLFHADDHGNLLLLSRDSTLLRSTDGGKSWKTVFDISLNPNFINEVLTGCFSAGDTIFVSTNFALYRSIDAGASWEKAPDPDFYGPLQVVGKIGDTFVGRRSSAIVTSADGGLKWKNAFTTAFTFAAVAVLDTTIFGMYSDYARLIRSENRGMSWEAFDADSIQSYHDFNGDRGWLNGTSGNLYFATYWGCQNGVFYSTDRGETWSGTTLGLLPEQVLHDLQRLDTALMAGTTLGVYRSTDHGRSFSPSQTGMNASSIDNLFQRPNGQWWVAARQGIFRSADQGQSWEAMFPDATPIFCFGPRELFQTARRMFYPDADNCRILASDDNGNTWSPLPPWPHTPWPDYFCPGMVVTGNTAWFRGYDAPLYRWHDQEAAPTPYIMPFLSKVSTMEAGDGMLYMADEQSAYLSGDEGATWQSIPPVRYWKGEPDYGYPMSIDRHAIIRRTGMFLDSLFIYDYSHNAWRPYFPVDAVEADTFNVYAITMFRYTGGLRWMHVTGRGLYYSSIQEPERWFPYYPQLPELNLQSMYLADNEIWVGTAEAGIFRMPLQFHTSENATPQFSLYPNPGNGASLYLTSNQFFREPANLRVFDAAGRWIHEQDLLPGQFWTLDVQELSSGMYIFQINATQHVEALKWVKH